MVANAGKKTHGRWTTGDQAADAVPIVSGRKDDMYQVTQAHLASVGMGHYAIASINNTPCPGPLGCDTLLPAVLPPGATLTVYGTAEDGTPTVDTYTGGPQ